MHSELDTMSPSGGPTDQVQETGRMLWCYPRYTRQMGHSVASYTWGSGLLYGRVMVGPVYRGLRVTVQKCHSTCLMYIRLKVAVQKGCGMAQDMLLTVQNLFRTSDLSPGLEDATLSRAHTILGSRT